MQKNAKNVKEKDKINERIKQVQSYRAVIQQINGQGQSFEVVEGENFVVDFMELFEVEEDGLQEQLSEIIKDIQFYTVDQSSVKQVQVFPKNLSSLGQFNRYEIAYKESLFEGNDLQVQMICEFEYDSSWSVKAKKPHQIEINLSSSDDEKEEPGSESDDGQPPLSPENPVSFRICKPIKIRL